MSDPSSLPRLRLTATNALGSRPPTSPSRFGNISDGASSDCDRPHGATALLDVKRLLSKPAAPSRASLYSGTSDSDSPAVEVLRSHSPSLHSSHTLISTAPWLGFSGGARLTPSMSRYSQAEPVSSARPSTADRLRTRHDSSPLRNSPTSQPALMATTAPGVSADCTTTGEKDKDKDRPRLLRKRSQRKGENSALHPAISSLGVSSSMTARRPSTADGRLTHTGAMPSPKLTPAAAFAQAYKEQGVRRERLAATARGELSSPDSPDYPSRRTSVDAEGGAQPYYTVFGSQDTYAADSNDERRLDICASPLPPSIAATAPTSSVRRSLVRKVSGRFSRHKAASSFAAGISELPAIPSVKSRSSSSQQSEPRKSGSEPRKSGLEQRQNGEQRKSEEPRKSLQERRSMSLPQERRKSLQLTLDGLGVGVEELPYSKHKDSGAVSDGSPNASTGGKLWRLVKRISSTGLNGKYQARTGEPNTPALSPPPPVPEIPKDLLAAEGSLTPRPQNQPWQPPSAQISPSPFEPRGRRPSTATGMSKPSPISGRRSNTTRSSSPSSFFRPRTPSSASSVAEDVPPIPPILSPRAKRHDLASEDHFLSLPSSESGEGPSSGLRPPPSPDMPVFSIAGSVNNFSGQRRPSLQALPGLPDVHASVSPPPRPARSPHRPPVAGTSPPSSSLPSASTSPSPATRRVSQDILGTPERAESESGHSMATVSTARPSRGSSDPGAAPRVRMTFREMNTGPSAARTAQEKDAMWDDLLERSALAGGTLHLGSGALMSDTLRFSTISSTSSLSTHS
ncbi:hypothetical protein K488DRAFT_73414 [Vararia minispora EC-137]|uniref:Uncharacterized protein n=1 Tax=Vararia minispora EC-137 TaxID=1314806 RepID=A0ACB8QAP4_9AGAM|nr:hypothetical protein K488DRAFT_73414 [Vararia minispora EC-137]